MAHRKTQKKHHHYNPLDPSSSSATSSLLPSFGSVPIVPHTLQIIFRLSRPRTWIFPASSFLLGYTVAGGTSPYQIALGLIVAGLVTAATNIVNAYCDRHEDAVNQPRRVFWIEQVGSNGTVGSCILLYGAAIAAGVFLGPLFLLVLAVGVFNSIFYSAKPLRFKSKPVPSLISFSGAVGLAFLSGISISNSINLLNPVFIVVTYFMLTYGTVKNLPDYTGDKKAGTHTTATIFRSVRNAAKFSGLFLFTPYLLLTCLVAFGILDSVFLIDLGLIGILTVIVVDLFRAKTAQDLEKAHTYGFFYAISFLLFTIVLAAPTLRSIVIMLAAYLWTLLVSKVNIDSRVENRDWETNRPSTNSRRRNKS